MLQEEDIKNKLIKQFNYLDGRVNIQRARRMTIELEQANFMEVFEYAAKQLKFIHLCTITGLDNQDKLDLMYHLAHDEGILLTIKFSVPKETPLIKTVIPSFPGAEIYERELVDLLGFKVEGLPAGNRYPLTDEWPTDQYPLRKDWKPDTGSSTEKV
jgi:Ni,Fe-hydrogenase III component G